jgi:predicted aspartyl protease
LIDPPDDTEGTDGYAYDESVVVPPHGYQNFSEDGHPYVSFRIRPLPEAINAASEDSVAIESQGITGVGLVDTGASVTIVDANFIQELGISSTDLFDDILCLGEQEGHKCNAYWIEVELEHHPVRVQLKVAAMPIPFEGVQCLLGMDLLRQYDFWLLGPRGVFRIKK